MNHFIISDLKIGQKIRVFTIESEEASCNGEYQGTDFTFIKLKDEHSDIWYIAISSIVAFRTLKDGE